MIKEYCHESWALSFDILGDLIQAQALKYKTVLGNQSRFEVIKLFYFQWHNSSLLETSAKMNVSLFTDDEGETTDTADSSEQEYKYGLINTVNTMLA